MKLKALVLALFVSGIGGSFALADDGGTVGTGSTSTATATSTSSEHGKSEHSKSENHGKPEHDGKHGAKDGTCRPEITVELKGSFVSAASDSFVMNVEHANHHGHGLAGTQVTIGVDDKTKIKRHGHATLADLKAGDRLSVKARACKNGDAAPAAAGTSPQFVARKVDAHPAKADQPKGDDHHEHGTTTTTTTTSTP